MISLASEVAYHDHDPPARQLFGQMQHDSAHSHKPPSYLSSLLGEIDVVPHLHVTLTFAQSIDAKIAGAHGKQLILSGKESMVMTHWMRTMHDAILIGIGTALNDDPQLNTRHLPALPSGEQRRLPRPVVLDSKLRFKPDCKLLKNFREGTGRRPWIITSRGSFDPLKHRELANAGARVFITDSVDGSLSVDSILFTLRQQGIRSVMVEGGAQIINSFLRAKVAHSLVITVAPTLVGKEGVSYDAEATKKFEYLSTEKEGRDTVVVFTSAK